MLSSRGPIWPSGPPPSPCFIYFFWDTELMICFENIRSDCERRQVVFLFRLLLPTFRLFIPIFLF